MPVTFAPAARTGAHDAHPATSGDVAPVTAAKLLSAASCSANVGAKARIARCCIGGRPGPDNTDFKIAPAPGNGFVDTVLCAYTNHHALVIRPDDVWLAVVSQFSFYATAEGNSCSFFDNASGKISSFALEISVESDTAQPNLTRLSRRMMRLLPKIIPDADLRDWLIPNFSTTTLTDTTVSCLLVLSGSCSSSSPTATQTRSGGEVDHTLGACGIPRVTLEGERADWEMLLARLDRLKLRCKDFGLPAVAWYHLLHPVLAGFVGAFDDPERVENREFWGGVVVGKEESNGSMGGSKNAGKLSGWITAFCAFSVEGTWLGPELNASTAADEPETLTATQFWSTYTHLAPAPAKPKPKPKPKGGKAKGKKALQFDLDVDPPAPSAPTIVIALADVPRAYASVDLELSLKIKTKLSCDSSAGVNGTATTRERTYTALAGLVGTGFSSSRDTELSATGRNDTVRPVVAWWIYEPGGAGADANGNQKVEVRQDAKNMKDKEHNSEEHIPVVPAPCVRFDLDRDAAGAGLGVGLESTTTSGAGTGAAETHEPEPEPVSALAPVQQSSLWDLNLDTPVIPEPPSQPAAPTSAFEDPHPDAEDHEPQPDPVSAPVQQSSPWDLDLDTPVIPEPPSQPAAPTSAFEDPHPDAEDPEPQPDPESAPVQQSSPWDLDLDTPVIPEPPSQPAAPTPTPAFEDPQPDAEDPQPQPDPENDAAAAAMPAGNDEDAADEAPAAVGAKAGGKNNTAGGAKGGKGKKKKKGK
ncbi:hypothetical protein B0H13DRAFT_2455400 [Mycena leptocephala]|nr:hypothetical protein B0H13DRAFT_2455400 [Mycena leptocephala]